MVKGLPNFRVPHFPDPQGVFPGQICPSEWPRMLRWHGVWHLLSVTVQQSAGDNVADIRKIPESGDMPSNRTVQVLVPWRHVLMF